MAKPKPIARKLSGPGVHVEVLTQEETAALQQRWRETFARRVHRATGAWTHLGFDWHAFSYDFVYSLTRDDARNAYRQRVSPDFVVLPHKNEEPGYRVQCRTLPALHGLDAYVCPPSFEWTMVFTHEEDWCGPYFTTAEWAQHREPAGKGAG